MHPQMSMLRCVIMRGGTSKAVFLRENDLPKDKALRDKIILSVFGSPDVRQIDGLGGADVLTSKLAIIGPSSRSDADVDYLFAQVGIDKPVVDYKGNCGNISSAVGPFAIDEGLVRANEPMTTVRINQVNTNRLIVAEVSVIKGKAAVEGELAIDGVPGTGAPITLDFSDTAGSVTGKLLPTGNVKDKITVRGKAYEVSLVDAGNPHVFIHAKSLGLRGTETPQEIESNKELMGLIEEIRGVCACLMGIVDVSAKALTESPYIPFFAIVSSPADYKTFNTGREIKFSDIDIVSRLIFMQRMHKTYPGTGTVCTGAAAKIPGTIVNELLTEEAKGRKRILIGHPAGVIPVEAETIVEDGMVKLTRAAILRTARRIMEGYTFVKNSAYSK